MIKYLKKIKAEMWKWTGKIHSGPNKQKEINKNKTKK